MSLCVYRFTLSDNTQTEKLFNLWTKKQQSKARLSDRKHEAIYSQRKVVNTEIQSTQ